MTSTPFAILKVLKSVENRFCCDCDTALASSAPFAVLNYGVWVCGACAAVHNTIRSDSPPRVKNLNSKWSKDEIDIMIKAGSNVQKNKVLERYMPSDWSKVSPSASTEDRTMWIRAKYDARLFSLPYKFHGSMCKSPQKSRREIADLKKVLPNRLIDFFLIFEPKTVSVNLETYKNISAEVPLFEPCITSAYPLESVAKNNVIPEMMGDFIFPLGVHLTSLEKPPFFFTFVLTNDLGVKLYGGTLHIYELVDPEDIPKLLKLPSNSPALPTWPVVYAPKALTLISHYPFFNLFREFLEQLYHVSLSVAPLPIERYIAHFVNEVPLPPQGKIQVNYSIGHHTLSLTRPPKNQLPMVDFSYVPVFELLSIDNILLIFAALCAERPVCIFSENLSLLTPICESFISFLFPFVWQGVYVPVMPTRNLDILDAPIPFLIGTHSRYLRDTPAKFRPENVVLVDADSDVILQGIDDMNLDAHLPVQGSKLKGRLETYSANIYHRNHMKDINNAGISFLFNEHLTPIVHFAFTDGVKSKISKTEHNSNTSSNNHSIIHSFGILKPFNSTTLTAPLSSTKSSSSKDTVLDPANNVQGTDGFNANEIRLAFTKFFVSLLVDYQQYLINSAIIDGKDGINTSNSLTKIPEKSVSFFSLTSVVKRHKTSISSNSSHSVHGTSNFKAEEYLHNHNELFLRKL